MAVSPHHSRDFSCHSIPCPAIAGQRQLGLVLTLISLALLPPTISAETIQSAFTTADGRATATIVNTSSVSASALIIRFKQWSQQNPNSAPITTLHSFDTLLTPEKAPIAPEQSYQYSLRTRGHRVEGEVYAVLFTDGTYWLPTKKSTKPRPPMK